jgi:hypothetical protein
VSAPVIVVALLFWVCVFAVYFTSAGITPTEFFFGRFEPLPADLGSWKRLGADAPSGLEREERRLLPEGRRESSYLLLQVRYRDPATGEIVRIDAERRVPRLRASARP